MAFPKFGANTPGLFACPKNAEGVPEAVPVTLIAGEYSVVWSRERECFGYDCLVGGYTIRILEGAMGDQGEVTQMASKLRDPHCAPEVRLAKAYLQRVPVSDAHPAHGAMLGGNPLAGHAQMAPGAETHGPASAEAEQQSLPKVCRCMSAVIAMHTQPFPSVVGPAGLTWP